MTYHLPNGISTVVLNPLNSAARRASTLMEEVGHLHLRHGPSVIARDPASGLLRRSYDKRVEEEAYWFGAAFLVPKVGLRELYRAGQSPAAVATHYGVSSDLIRFRTNIHRLHKIAG